MILPGNFSLRTATLKALKKLKQRIGSSDRSKSSRRRLVRRQLLEQLETRDLMANIVAVSPEDGAINWALTTDLTINFDVPVAKGQGNIHVVRDNTGVLGEAIDVNSAAVTISGSTVTVDIPNDLLAGTAYHVLIDNGAFIEPSAQQTTDAVLLTQNFDLLPLSPFATVSGGDGTDFTLTPPLGFTVDNSAMATGGVPEYKGWSFMDKQPWINQAGDQSRSAFTLGSGTVAIGDPDQFDDAANGGPFNSTMFSRPISLVGVAPGTAKLEFDSSFRPEDAQIGVLQVRFDSGAWEDLLTLNPSNTNNDPPSASNINSNINEHLISGVNTGVSSGGKGNIPFRALQNPAGASSMQLRWSVTGKNTWWWAVDNLKVTGTLTGIPFAGVSSPTFWNLDIPKLSVTIDRTAMSENGGVATGTVTRNGSTANWASPLLVTLASDDTTEATVPANVTIPAGQASVTFPITAVDDTIADRTQVATISANATDFAPGANSLNILDDEGPKVVSLTPPDNSTGVDYKSNFIINLDVPVKKGNGLVNIVRSSNNLVVNSLDINSAAVTVVNSATTSTVTIDPTINLNGLTDYYILIDDGALIDLSGNPSAGAQLLRQNFDLLPLGNNLLPTGFSVTNPGDWQILDKAAFVAAGGNTNFAGTGPVAVTTAQDSFLITSPIDLTGIAANSIQLEFDASYAGGLPKLGAIQVSFNEGSWIDIAQFDSQGNTRVVINNAGVTGATLLSTLTTPNSGTMRFRFGQLFSSGGYMAIDNLKITGQVSGLPFVGFSDSAQWNFTTAEAPNLTVTVDRTSISENGGTAIGTVSRNLSTSGNLVVGLSSSDTTEATVPATVTIPDGQASVTFNISGVDDTNVDGSQPVVITATAVDYFNVPATVTVLDDDYPRIVSVSPADNSAAVPVDSNLVITFDQNVKKGNGFVHILRVSDGKAVASIDIRSSAVTVSGAVVTVNPPANLAGQSDYFIAFDGGSVVSTATTVAPAVTLFTEDFELLTLGPAVFETAGLTPNGKDYTATPPASFVTDNSLMPPGGVPEWTGWTFPVKSFWATAGDQNRANFALGTNTIAVADTDEWDDTATLNNNFNGIMRTNPIDLSGVQSNSVSIEFDSSFRPENSQTGKLDVSFDGGTNWTNLLTMDPSNTSNATNAANINQRLSIPVSNPTSGSMVFRLGVTGANDWWWAIDNVKVIGNLDNAPSDGIARNAATTWNFSTAEAKTLTVTVSPTAIAENGGTATATVTRNLGTTGPVTVTLVSSDTSLATVPTSVEIPDGQASATFTITAVDDNFADGLKLVNITASSADFVNGVSTLSITDNETPNVLISEIMYNPAGAEPRTEWMELYNRGTETVDLSSWKFDDEDNTNWTAIPAGTLLPVGRAAVIYNSFFNTLSESQFRTAWSVPNDAIVVGVLWGDLNNSPGTGNEVIRLRDAGSADQRVVNYDDDGTVWPAGANGPSIYLKDITTDNTVGTNWARSVSGADFAKSPTSTIYNAADVGSPGRVPLNTIAVNNIVPSSSAVAVKLNKAFDPLKLNIVDSNNVNGASDVTLVGSTVGAVKGSVILDADNKGFTFIKTGGPLEADTYTLTLRSAANGFTDATGSLLDGDFDNVAGADFVQQFTVTAPASGAITLRVGDFVRGYGQAVNLPANSTSGLPITISTGVNVTGASFTVNYNPALLTITGGTTSIAGATVTVNTSVAGQAVVNVTSGAEFSAAAGLLTLVNLTAVIPDTAPNGSKGLISISGVTLTSADTSPLVSTTDDGYLIASYKGDVNNNRAINTGDVTGLLRSVSGALSTTGFPSLKLADPALVGDMNDSTTLTAGDVTGLLRFISGANGGFAAIPSLPEGITPPAPGADPQVFVPQNLVATPGSTVVVPININVTEPTGASVAGIDVSFTYDTSRYTFASVATGGALSGFTFSSSNNTATAGFARLVFATDFGPAFANGFVGTLLTVTLNVLPGAASGASAVNLTAVGLSDNDTNDLLISPPVTPGVDSSDGIITIPGAGNSAPTDIGLSAATIAENAGANATVGTLSTTDPNAGDSFTYTLVSGTGSEDNAAFNISGSTLRATASLDFEAKPSYNVRLRSTDGGGLFFEKAFVISATNVNETPVFSPASYSFSIAENSAASTAVGTVTATDPDASTTLTYSLSGTGASNFVINASTGAITVAAGATLNFEGTNTWNLTATASDGTLSTTAPVVISLTNVNESPVFSPSSYSFTIAENSAASTAVGKVTATDPDAATTLTYSLEGVGASNFVINASTGAITVAAGAVLNFEGTTSFSLNASVSDGTLSSTAAVTIEVTNANEAPVFAPASYNFSLAENSASGTAVGTVVATDVDGGTTLTYSLSGTGASNFVINASTGAITVAAGATLDFEGTNSWNLTATVSDGSLTATAPVVISLTNVNETPVFSPTSYSFSIAENSATSTAVGTVTATDPDASTTLTYSLSGTGASNFVINASTGAITVAAGATLNFEGTNTWNLTATASDGTLSTTAPVVISLTNVNESPVITSGNAFTLAEANTIGIQGTQSSATPYLTSRDSNVQFSSILTVGDAVSGYRMVGIPDGMGAYDNGDGTFTLLMNHELNNTVGIARAHGQPGAFVSKWIINKSTLQVVSIEDFLRNGSSVFLSNNDPTTSVSHTAYLAAATTLISRLCSADLAAPTAYQWTDVSTGTTFGTSARIFQSGEESGGSVASPFGPEANILFGRQFAFVATDDPNTTTINEAGTAWELPHAGLFSWENNVANPLPQRKTVVVGLDDSTGGQIYVWVGNKQTTGNVVERAGLTKQGAEDNMFVVKVAGLTPDASGATNESRSTPLSGTFTLENDGDVSGLTLAGLETLSDSKGATQFFRPEDGQFDPANPNDFYFLTTDQYDQAKDGIGSQIGRSRLYRLRFTDITNPTAGGTITAVLDGTEAGSMFDNMTISNGKAIMQEDVGNQQHLGKIWSYDLATDTLTEIAQHDRARFGDVGIAATAPFTQDEESSGVIDVSSILGAGTYLLNVQAHYNIGDAELVEGGQLLMMRTNVTTGQSLVTTVTANDAESSALTYAISGGADQADFVIDPATGRLSFAVAPNFESPADANTDNVYQVQVSVSDGVNAAVTQDIQVTVTAVNETPTNTTLTSVAVTENSTAVTTATGTDPEGTTLTYAISGGADAAKFAINATGALSFIAAPDFESPTDNGANNSYFVTVTVSDGVTAPVNKTIVVTLTNANESPVFSPSSYSFSIAENAAASTAVGTVTATDPDASTTLTYSLSGTGASNFVINASTGAITVAAGATLNFEGTNTWNLTATASDGTLSTTAPVVISLTNVNESPVFSPTSYNFSIAENSASSTAVGTVTATDPDASTTLTYSLSGTGASNFVINFSTGAITVAAGASFNAATTPSYTLTATASDGSLSTTASVTVSVTAAAPSLVSVAVNGGDTFKNPAQRSEITSLVIGFSAPVVVSAGAFSIANVGLVTSQTPVELAQSQILVTADASQMVYTIRFAPGAGVVSRSGAAGTGRGNSLADGNFVLSIDPTKVTRSGVNLSASNTLGDGDNQFGDLATDDFFRMFGDGNGDGVVSTTDTGGFRASLSAYDAAFDADGDGVVLNSGVDRSDFLSNFGKRRRR